MFSHLSFLMSSGTVSKIQLVYVCTYLFWLLQFVQLLNKVMLCLMQSKRVPGF